MTKLVYSALIIMICCGWALAEDKGAQEERCPTVGSEIKRGFLELKDSCDISKHANAQDFDRCVALIAYKEWSKHKFNDAFALGFYYSAWISTDTRKDAITSKLAKNPNGPDKSYTEKLQGSADSFFITYRSSQKSFQITDKQLCEVVNLHCEKVLPKVKKYRDWLESDIK